MVVLLLVLNSFSLLSDGSLDCEAEVVVKVQAPPAAVLMQEPQRQMPTARPFILVLPQKEQVCLARWRFPFSSPFS